MFNISFELVDGFSPSLRTYIIETRDGFITVTPFKDSHEFLTMFTMSIFLELYEDIT